MTWPNEPFLNLRQTATPRGDAPNGGQLVYVKSDGKLYTKINGVETVLGAGGDVTLNGVQTLTNKTIALGSNTVSGTTAQFNTALTDDDFATLTNSVTLTNKTLTAPTITDPTVTVGSKTAKFVIVCTSGTRPSHSAGQEIYETDTDRSYRSDGTAWRYLNGGTDPTAARAFASGSTTLSTNGAGVTIALASEAFDYGNNFASNTYTAPRAGLLAVSGRVSVGTPAAGDRILVSIYVNGAEAIRGYDGSAANTNPIGGPVSGVISVASGDLVTLRAGGVSAAGRATEVGTTVCYLDCRMLP